jgi:hypothetical protein
LNLNPPPPRRDERVTVRLTAEERRLLERRAGDCGRTVSTFMREAALGSVPRRSAGAAGRETRYHLGRIGNNLNQLAHKANSTGRLTAERELLATVAELRRILEEISV